LRPLLICVKVQLPFFPIAQSKKSEQVMSTSFRIDAQLGVIFTICCEKVTDSEVLNYLQTLPQDAGFSPAFSHLIDCSQVTSFEVSADLTRSVAGKKLFSSRSKCAIVAPQDYIYGMARMFELQYHGDVQVFRDLLTAQIWLGIDHPTCTPAQHPPGIAARAS
jgi:hypothetical protein